MNVRLGEVRASARSPYINKGNTLQYSFFWLIIIVWYNTPPYGLDTMNGEVQIPTFITFECTLQCSTLTMYALVCTLRDIPHTHTGTAHCIY
jgi:hypothetical protein